MGWGAIVGQKRAVRLLQASIDRNRIHHAYLFAGPPGVGKTTAALTFAQALSCGEPDRPCGTCLPCRQVAGRTYPDTDWIVPDGDHIRIEQVRELGRRTALRPYHGPWKVFVVEPAEAMTEQAQNALLKCLEEPPGETVLVLISHVPTGLLPTIASRCVRIPFDRIPRAEIERALRRQGKDREGIRLLATLAAGRLAWALETDLAALLARRDEIAQMAGTFGGEATDQLLAQAQAWQEDKDRVDECLALLEAWLRDLLVWLQGGRHRPGGRDELQELVVNVDRFSLIEQQAGRWSVSDLVRALAQLTRTRRQIAGNVNVRTALDVLMLRLSGGVQTAREGV